MDKLKLLPAAVLSNEHYYRLIPKEELDIVKILADLDKGVNLILDGLDAMLVDDTNSHAVSLIMKGLSALTYNRYLM